MKNNRNSSLAELSGSQKTQLEMICQETTVFFFKKNISLYFFD